MLLLMVFGKYHSLFFSSLAIYLAGFSWTRWEVFLSLWQIWHWTHCWRCCYGKLCFFVSKFVNLYFFDSPSKFVVFQENSFLRAVGHVELDLPEAPEKAPRPPPLAVDPSSRYGPKAEITHIFRAPEKRPPQELALAFLGLTLLPLVGFLIGVSFFLLRILNKLFLIVISCSQNSCWPIKVSLTNCEVI